MKQHTIINNMLFIFTGITDDNKHILDKPLILTVADSQGNETEKTEVIPRKINKAHGEYLEAKYGYYPIDINDYHKGLTIIQ